MKKEIALVEVCETEIDKAGYGVKDWREIARLKGTLLPEANQTERQETGIDEKVDFRFFYKGGRPIELQKGMRMTVRRMQLYIVSMLDYGKVLDISLSKELTKNG